MLSRLIIIFFVVGIQTFPAEGFMPSSDAMANAVQQAKQVKRESDKRMEKNSDNNPFKGKQNSHCCSSHLLQKEKGANKGCVKNITAPASEKDNTAQILVFVSFSMPELSLKSLFQEAHQHNAVLVMRGLYQDSFVRTVQKLQELGVTIDINPELFEAHNITSVPTFIVLKNSHSAHMLRGNVTLEFATQKLKNKQFKGLQLKERAP